MENKQNSVSERISSLSYTARLSLWFLIFSVVVMFSSFIFSWMIQPAVYFTIFSIGAVFGLLNVDQQECKHNYDGLKLIKELRHYWLITMIVPLVFMFFSYLRPFAVDAFFITAGGLFSLSLVKRHLERNLADEVEQKDENDGFKYVEEIPKRLINWNKLIRIALAALLIFTPIYFFADYQRHQVEIMLKSKTGK